MTITRENIEANTAHWRRVLGKDRAPAAGERKLTQAERFAAWSASVHAAERQASASEGRTVVATARASVFTAYQVGDQRYAADGTLWRRTA
ncbi:hypothetical protein AFCDBAGC_5136 [Methylobacterium cerastii]|uniref:Uncharacterized protein n=1 Tax=Methylobacterium cerastii TaxID=932741 RepID=A0ABQ4QPM8_9HYPH|nr:hypothetical protein [Methylobacterium cerastii]GJD47243.1 hypothetical protein AFCDBAGC_5136 [Methylobacterium cerastii]